MRVGLLALEMPVIRIGKEGKGRERNRRRSKHRERRGSKNLSKPLRSIKKELTSLQIPFSSAFLSFSSDSLVSVSSRGRRKGEGGGEGVSSRVDSPFLLEKEILTWDSSFCNRTFRSCDG